MKPSTTIPLFISATALSAGAASMSDHFNDRPQVGGVTEILSADTSFATLEPGEESRMHGNLQNHTVWAAWTAPANGWVTIDTAGTSFTKPVIAIYTGDSLADLKAVARGPYVSSYTPSSARFPVAQGTVYQIVLDSSSTSRTGSGLGQVNIRLEPSAIAGTATGTDRFADRPVLEGIQAFGVANNDPATLDPFQPENTGNSRKDVWWQWTAPATGLATIDTLESDFNTILTVFAGAPLNDPPFSELDMVASNNDVPNSEYSQVTFQTQAGRTYQIAVSGSGTGSSSRGNVIMKLDLAANASPGAVPGSDFFINRPDLEGLATAGVACNTHCSVEAFEQVPGGDSRHSVWWQWTAPETCVMDINTLGSGIDTMLRIYQGSDLATLAEVSFNDNAPGAAWSQLALRAVQGTVYQIRVDSRGSSSNNRGNIVLNLTRLPEPEIDIQQPLRSSLADGRSKRAFGAVRRGSAGITKVFTIHNAGSGTLAGISIRRTGRNGGDFIISPPTKTSLTTGTSTTFKVTFKPMGYGTRTARISILSNDSDENPFEIDVAGMGSRR